MGTRDAGLVAANHSSVVVAAVVAVVPTRKCISFMILNLKCKPVFGELSRLECVVFVAPLD